MISMFQIAIAATLLLQHLPAAASDHLPVAIGMEAMGAGHLFVNDEGLTLYTFKRDREQPDSSACVEECAAIWPPVLAPADAATVGVWSTVARPDGTYQWAHRGRPVYTHVKDTHPGAILGEKASRLWDVLYEPIAMPPDIVLQGSVLGQILTDLNGHTIYAQPYESCNDACMRPWRPVEAPWLASPVGERWTIVQRNDGPAQWAYNGRGLFTYDGDFRTGDTNGTDAVGSWDVVILQPAPAIPSWITFQETDIGPVMANQDRMTLYYQMNDPDQIRRETCDDQCVEDNWLPVAPNADEKPVGNWTFMETPDGRQQWAYLGYPVYIFKYDEIPGDIYGDKFGTGSEIRGGWNAILKETLIQKLVSS